MLSREYLEFFIQRPNSASAGSIREMARELLATRWRPITETDLPKVGDELWSEKNGVGDFAHFCTNRMRQLDKQLQACGWTHFRPKSPPARTDKGEA